MPMPFSLLWRSFWRRSAPRPLTWSEGYTNQEDEGVREVLAAFEQKTGKQVELVLHPEHELPDRVVAAVEAGRPPDFVFSIGRHPGRRTMGL
jgi:ABC-type glycerol-3-phosphate transport system substrate-binding protein